VLVDEAVPGFAILEGEVAGVAARVAGFEVGLGGAGLDEWVAVGVGAGSAWAATVPVGPDVAKMAPATMVASALAKRRMGTGQLPGSGTQKFDDSRVCQ
jgi:hypothetical protein